MTKSLTVEKNTGFDLKPANINEAMSLATMISGSCLAPKDFKGKPEDTLVAMMLGNELGLNPLQSIQNIAVVNGRPSVWGDALLALVQNHPSFGYIEETFDDRTMTATCVVGRKGGKPHTSTFSKADAETAGLWGRNTWKQYPKRMLAMRARGFALRNQFADALLGLVTREEALDMPEAEERDMGSIQVIDTPKKEPAKEVAHLPACPDDYLSANMNKFSDGIKGGRTAQFYIDWLSAKYSLTEEQINQIKDLEKPAGKVIDTETGEEINSNDDFFSDYDEVMEK